ncbi:hypothetical protein ACIQ4I_17100 [Rummeliibacillus sp. NPDC094406]|uniref:hypothetical protein n=1 Tax=Rummeliibacillus sp. NPDC094406 TaxID=3364511 RepID=UPI0037FA1074
MSGKKATLIVIGIVLVCMILIFLSIFAFFKNNPHQPNQKSLGLTPEVAQTIISYSRY